MKKIMSWILLVAMLLGMFAGCGKSQDPTQPSTDPVEIPEITATGENNALDVVNYLQAIYKDSGAKTAGNFERFGIVRIAGVPYEVVWTADVGEDLVKIIVNDDGTVTIDVNEKCPEDTIYVLTATITDANGNTETASWEYLLPGTASLEEMQATVDEAYALEKGEALSEERVLSGVIKSIDTPYSDQYQNITVTIQVEGREDKPIMCYRLKGEGAAELNPGDTITVQGLLKNYNGTIEFDAGCQLTSVEKTGTPVVIPTDHHQILQDVYALGDNESLPYGPITLTGRICSVDTPYSEQYKNITVTIIIDWYTVKCYRLKGEGAETLEMNDIITVKGYIKKYNGTREFDVPELLDVVKVGEVPQPADQMHVVKVAYDLDPGWTVPYGEVTLTGTITKVGTAWSDQYENITVTIAVDGDDVNNPKYPIICYRMVANTAAMEKAIKTLQVGDRITAKGILMKYQDTKAAEHLTDACKVELNVPELRAVTSYETVVMRAAAALEPNQTLTEHTLSGQHVLPGKVVSIDTPYNAATKKVTVTLKIEDAQGKPSLQCVALTGVDADKIKKGDSIVVMGKVGQDAAGNVVLNNGTFIPAKLPNDDEKILDYAYSLQPGLALPGEASLTGQIISVDTEYSSQYKNITVTIQVGDNADRPVQCYRMKGTGAEKLGLGDVIKVTGILKNYNGKIEFDAGCTFELVRDGDPSEVIPESSKIEPAPGTELSGPFKYYIEQKNKGETYYFTGSMNGYYGASSTNPENGVDVYAETSTEGTRLCYMNGATKTYIDIVTSESNGKTHYNFKLVTEPTVYYELDKTYNTYVTTVDDTKCYIGTYNDYTTFGGSEYSKISSSFPAILGTPGESGGSDDDTTGDDTTTGTEVAKIVIYAPAYNMALSANKTGYNNYYNAGVELTSGYGETEIWTLLDNGDGTYSFANGGKTLGLDDSNSSMDFGKTNDDWKIIPQGNDTYYIQNTVRGNYIEWYAEKSNWSTYGTIYDDSKDLFTLSFMTIEGTLPEFGTGSGNEGGDDNTDTGEDTNPAATINFDNTSKCTSSSGTQQVWVENGITVTNNKNNSGNNVLVKDPVRLYQGSSLTIEYPGMTKIVVDCATYQENDYAAVLVNSISDGKVTRDGTVVTIELTSAVDSFTVTELTAQVRVDSISVYTDEIENESGNEGGGDSSTETPDVPETSEPVADSLITISQAITIGNAKGNQEYTEDKYYVTGTIDSFVSEYYGNLNIKDADGNVIYLHGLKSADGNVYFNQLLSKPQVGDTITVYGAIGKYNDAPQMSDVRLIVSPANSKLSIADANVLGLYASNYTEGKYYVSGTIDEIVDTTFGNMYIKDSSDNRLYLYGLYSADGTTRYDAMSTKPAVGDTITVYGKLGSYNGSAQMKSAWMTEHTVYVPDDLKLAATIIFAANSAPESSTNSEQVWQDNGITVTYSKGGYNNNLVLNTNPIRFYKNTTVKVEYTSAMDKIEVVCDSASYATALCNALTSAGASATVSDTLVTIKFDTAVSSFEWTNSEGQVRVNSISVYTK